MQVLSDVRDFGRAVLRPAVAFCYDEKTRVPPIKAATQKKRRDGVGASGMEFDVTSTKPIPAGQMYQPFIRYGNNRDKVASHIWEHITSTLEGMGRGYKATFVGFGVGSARRPTTTGGESGEHAPSSTVGEGAELPAVDTDPLPARIWRTEEGAAIDQPGPGIGEGELSTTHAIIHNKFYTREDSIRSWMVTSIDTDQIIHLLLAMAAGKINPRVEPGENKQVRVTVRRRKGQGVVEFVDVNRVYEALADSDKWEAGAVKGDGAVDANAVPQWLTADGGQAKVVLFVVMYFLGGCDFLPCFYNLKLEQMFKHVLATISQPGLFIKPIVKKADGKWTLDIEECVKMLGVCYFQMHWDMFCVEYGDGAAKLLQEVDGDKMDFIARVRLMIFKGKGPNGKKNCPGWDALYLQAQRAERVLLYWQSAFDLQPKPVEFKNHGWVADGKDDAELTSANCCVKLSDYAVTNTEGRVKFLTCTCTGGKSGIPFCEKQCKCHVNHRPCVPTFCKCKGSCVQNRKERDARLKAAEEAAAAVCE